MPGSPRINIRGGDVVRIGTHHGIRRCQFGGWLSIGIRGGSSRGRSPGGVLMVTLVYLAIADFLYIGRLAAYVAIVELPESPVALLIQEQRPKTRDVPSRYFSERNAS